MITEFKTLSPGDPLSRAVELTLAGFQQDFPVLDGSRLVGLLSYDDLLKAIAEHGPLRCVGEAMGSAPETASPGDELDGAMTRMHESVGRALTVVEDERVVGLLTVSNIGELLAMEAASRQAVVK